MRGMILAAGLGERMLPLTLHRAKPTLPLMYVPFIVHSIDYLRRFGIEGITVNLHHLPDSVTTILGDGSSFGVKIHYSREQEILGTAGGVKKVEEFLRSGTFVLMNSDFVSDIDLERAIEHHKDCGLLSTLVVMKPKSDGYSKLVIDDRMHVKAIGDNRGEHIFCGIHIIEPEIFDHIPPDRKLDINRDIYRHLISDGVHIGAYEHDGLWLEFGDLKRYLSCHSELAAMGKEFLNQLLNIGTMGWHMLETDPNEERFDPSGSLVISSGSFFLADSARCSGTVVIDDGCRIEPGTIVRNSLLHRNSVIMEGATLNECIVGESVTVPSGMNLARCAVSPCPEKLESWRVYKDIEKVGNLLIRGFSP